MPGQELHEASYCTQQSSNSSAPTRSSSQHQREITDLSNVLSVLRTGSDIYKYTSASNKHRRHLRHFQIKGAEAGVDAAGHMSGTACDGASAPPERCASVVGECWAHGIVVITTGVGVRPRARSGASVGAVVVETVAAEAHSAVRYSDDGMAWRAVEVAATEPAGAAAAAAAT